MNKEEASSNYESIVQINRTVSIIESMRNSMSILTFGKVDFDMTTLNKFVDLFADYKEKKVGEDEFHLDLT